jgi:D-alanyl-D-alanine carboxypeptidase
MTALARRIADSGVQRITGRVMGATTYFRRDWDATGWNDVARDYVARPTRSPSRGTSARAGPTS